MATVQLVSARSGKSSKGDPEVESVPSIVARVVTPYLPGKVDEISAKLAEEGG